MPRKYIPLALSKEIVRKVKKKKKGGAACSHARPLSFKGSPENGSQPHCLKPTIAFHCPLSLPLLPMSSVPVSHA